MKQPTPAQLQYWNSRRVLTPEQEAEIRHEYATLHTPHKALARKYNVSRYKIFIVLNTEPNQTNQTNKPDCTLAS